MRKFYRERFYLKALQQYQQFEGFLFTQVEDGVVSRRELSEILGVFANVVYAAGIDYRPEAKSAFEPILIQAMHQMKVVLLQQHPELTDALRDRGRGTER